MSFKSIEEASEKTVIDPYIIYKCCEGSNNNLQHQGLIFLYDKKEIKRRLEALKYTVSYPCLECTKTGRIMSYWENYKDAAAFYGLTKGTIDKCCKGLALSTMGRIFLPITPNIREAIDERVHAIEESYMKRRKKNGK